MTEYQVRELVGRGGMAEVYAAKDSAGRSVVVKQLLPTLADNRIVATKLACEASMLRSVTHHNVVRVLDQGVGDSGPFLVMDHVAGITLTQMIDRDGALPMRRAFAIASQLLAGVGAIHGVNICHGDVKASNVLVGADDRTTIIDFGLARPLTGPDRDDVIAGTPAYMAPELIRGARPAIASDLYAVAVVLYEMLTGATPFAGSDDVLHAHQMEMPVAPSERAPAQQLPRAVDRLLLRALDKSPANRFATAGQFARALDEIAADVWAMTTVSITQLAPVAAPANSDVQHLIVDALERAQARLDVKQPQAAISLLESVLVDVTTNDAWRLEMVLAAILDMTGDRTSARKVAASALAHAQAAGCVTAIVRTRSLLDRLVPRASVKPRMARGSGLFRYRDR